MSRCEAAGWVAMCELENGQPLSPLPGYPGYRDQRWLSTAAFWAMKLGNARLRTAQFRSVSGTQPEHLVLAAVTAGYPGVDLPGYPGTR
eukprot:2761308-Rhodomonas_salina.1